MSGHIFIYGGIGKEKGEIDFDNVNDQLTQSKEAEDLIVHLISPGGDVFEGEAIYNALKNSGKPITTHIEGTCASIATLIAAAGENVIMNKTARFMIHNPKISGFNQMADSRDLRHVANQLDKIKELLIAVYDKKTTLGKDKLWELYDNETWLTADEAQKMGFIDETTDAIKAVATININNIMKENKFQQMATAFKNLLGLAKIKNQIAETLTDNRTIVVIAEEGEDWIGKQVVLEDGSDLEDGTFTTQSGKAITVAAGNITDVQAAPPEAPAEDNKNQEMENKVKELEAQLAEAKAALETATTQAKANETRAVTAEANTVKIQNRVTQIEKDFIKLKEEASKTVGDTTPPPTGPVIKNLAGTSNVQDYDPMGEFVKQELKNRNLIHDED